MVGFRLLCEEAKKKKITNKVMGAEVSADLKGATMLSENSNTHTTDDGTTTTDSDSTKTTLDSKGMKVEHKDSNSVTNADGSSANSTTTTNAAALPDCHPRGRESSRPKGVVRVLLI